MSTAVQGRLSPADSALILGTLGFTVFLIQWRHFTFYSAVLSAAGAVALYTAVVLMPKVTRQLVVQVTALIGLVADAQATANALASQSGAAPVAGLGGAGAVTAPPVSMSSPQVVEGAVVPDGQGRP